MPSTAFQSSFAAPITPVAIVPQQAFAPEPYPSRKYADFLHCSAEAITFIRGRSIVKQWVIIDEAQNLTPKQVKGIITRAGTGNSLYIAREIASRTKVSLIPIAAVIKNYSAYKNGSFFLSPFSL